MLISLLQAHKTDEFVARLTRMNETEASAQLKMVDEYNWNVLHWAVHLGDARAIQTILSKVNLSDMDNPAHDGVTPLLLACQCPNGDMALRLMQGSNLMARDSKNRGPLHWACKIGLDNVAQALVKEGMDVTEKDNKQKTAVEYAARKGHTSIVGWLFPMTRAAQTQNSLPSTRMKDSMLGHTPARYAPRSQGKS